MKLYNQNLGGDDLADYLIESYRIQIRSKKYYYRILFHLLEMTVVNTWLLYRRDVEKCN